MNCRHCHAALHQTFLDLGHAPPSNAYLDIQALNNPETYYPLRVKVCAECWLVQTEDFANADTLFTPEYAYFSSTSKGWMQHAQMYAKQMAQELLLDDGSYVVEVASNDGYLLRNFVDLGVPCLGIEPTASTAEAAEKLGINVMREFFGKQLALQLVNEGKKADLIVGNNVYAHVPDINDFTLGLKTLLKQGGTITLEFPHLLKLIQHTQFDTIYHEHFSYLSLFTVQNIFASAGLRVFRVEELNTHGGSLRVYGCHAEDRRPDHHSVPDILQAEYLHGLQSMETYANFKLKVDEVRYGLINFLLKQKQLGKKVVAYGAAAKGNTLLNSCGIKPDLLPWVCDAAAAKQGKFMPGSHIPILSPEKLRDLKPDYLLILPWNIADEVQKECIFLKEKGTTFLIAVPEIKIL
jgi:hypothetical protein